MTRRGDGAGGRMPWGRRVAAWLAALVVCSGAQAEEPESVVVLGTRVAEPSAHQPAALDRIERERIQNGQLQVNLSESLMSVPGVNAQNRQNYAQDLQLSVRGFGARSSFGVRGVRLYADGIPGTMPDGQGQISHFDLGSADHIEVLRGPFSALYGNSSGGVIAIFSGDAPAAARVQASATYGSFATQREALQASGSAAHAQLLVDASHFSTSGYRAHSAAERNNLNAKARWQLDERSTLTLIANAVDIPDAQDPLGLTRAQLTTNPRQAGVNALAYNTRKSVQQQQLGAAYTRSLTASDELALMAYGGHRATTQFQAIPRITETAPAHPGGVIDLARAYRGLDLHATDHRTLAGTTLQVTGGFAYDGLDEARRGYLNFLGNQLGVEGAERRSEANRVYDLDEYLQAQWDLNRRWRAVGGVRHSLVDVRSHDHRAPAGANSSGVRYQATNPVAGLTFRVSPALDLYAAYGRGFETPTLNDLAYRSTNGSLPGLNLSLRPARSDKYEIGIQATGSRWRNAADLYDIRTVDELAVQSNASGRSVYENIPQTHRRGAEFELQGSWAQGFSGQLAYTYIQAQTSAPYSTCPSTPCTSVVITPGHRLAAVPANSVYTGLSWTRPGGALAVTLEAVGRARIYVDDRNSDAAAGYWVGNAHCDFEQRMRGWGFRESLRIDNLANRRYVGSVIVNESNGRYFEPEPGRSAYVMFVAERR
jgi:iron complex outermembrane recepter protein